MREPKFYTRELLNMLAPQYCRGKLVDVGAGRGKYKEIFQPYITEYVGVDDFSSDYQYRNREDKKFVHVQADAAHLPFVDGSFDTAVCTKVLEHVPDPQAVVSEIARVLKPGGYCLLSSDWFTPYHREPNDYWRFSEQGYRVLSDKAGLKWIAAHQQGGIFVAYNYMFWRSLELHGGTWSKKLFRSGASVRVWLDRFLSHFDRWSPDGVGHMIILQK